MTLKISSTPAMLATLTMLSCCNALAGDVVDDALPRWSVGGFGTLGVAHSNNDQADFAAAPLVPGDAGYSSRWSRSADSRVGVQLGVELTPDWSAVLQLVSERKLRHGYAPAVDWANLQYRISPDLKVRVGRIALPLFLTGDYRKVGYSLPWVRTPVELYGAVPLFNSDGVDASYRWQAGDAGNVTQASYGHADVPVAAQARVKVRRMAGLSHTTTAGALTVRAAVLAARLTADLERPLFDELRAFGPQGASLADRYELADTQVRMVSLGFGYDPGQWFVMGEIGRLQSPSYLGDKTGAYLSAGYRAGDLTPYLMFAKSRPNTQTAVDGLDLAGLPAARAAVGMQLNAGVNRLLATIPRQYTASAGLRWDLQPGYALKLQCDRVMPQQGSTGTFINVQPGFRPGRAVVILSAALDFVF